jgi:hypothetical protein
MATTHSKKNPKKPWNHETLIVCCCCCCGRRLWVYLQGDGSWLLFRDCLFVCWLWTTKLPVSSLNEFNPLLLPLAPSSCTKELLLIVSGGGGGEQQHVLCISLRRRAVSLRTKFWKENHHREIGQECSSGHQECIWRRTLLAKRKFHGCLIRWWSQAPALRRRPHLPIKQKSCCGSCKREEGGRSSKWRWLWKCRR